MRRPECVAAPGPEKGELRSFYVSLECVVASLYLTEFRQNGRPVLTPRGRGAIVEQTNELWTGHKRKCPKRIANPRKSGECNITVPLAPPPCFASLFSVRTK
jgi:hypothetical protein